MFAGADLRRAPVEFFVGVERGRRRARWLAVVASESGGRARRQKDTVR